MANFNTQMTTNAVLSQRDLILGGTQGSDTQFPGMVVMSKFANPGVVTFAQADLFGSWQVYLHRVDSKQAGSTSQIGRLTFNSLGAFASGVLRDATNSSASTSFVAAPTSALTMINGSVTGTLVAVGTSATADRYTLLGAMRATKDVITGVLTANLSARTTTHYGLVTLVRDVTLFDFSQPAFSVTEGGTVTVTVLRTGNLAGTVTVNWSATAGAAQLTGPTAGLLTFPTNIASQTFTVTTAANAVVDGNRSVTLTLSSPTGTSAMLGATPGATVNILDEDRTGLVKLSAANYSVAETGKNALITIVRTGTNLAANVSVQFTISDGTALAGRDYVVPEDVKAVAVPALAHRLTLRPELWVQRLRPDDIVADLLDQVPTPKAEAASAAE